MDTPPGTIAREALILYDLFALSVLNDLLIVHPLLLSAAQYRRFFEALGFSLFSAREHFNPLTCEVVELSNWPKAEKGICVWGCCYWPGLRFGDMIFSRCGVSLGCHPSHGIVEGIADCSHLYFTNRRLRRPCSDLSHGWGSNSRWATTMRRDYVVGGFAFCNVDADVDLYSQEAATEGLPLNLARELLLHRCFVSHPDIFGDLYPYVWRMALTCTNPLEPLAAAPFVPFSEALRAVGIPEKSPARGAGSRGR